jgi:hypothetical protein
VYLLLILLSEIIYIIIPISLDIAYRNEQVMISSLTGCLHQLKNYARNAVINYYIILNHICVVLRAKRLMLMTKWEKY